MKDYDENILKNYIKKKQELIQKRRKIHIRKRNLKI